MIWDTSRPAVTAEWQCTRCAATNRKLMAPHASVGFDRCVHCKTSHAIGKGPTPVRWDAKAEP